MNLLFSNPIWIVSALVAVPLLAHLFSRARPQARAFPSLRLLREAMRRVTRVRRPRDWLLLLLRTLAMAALLLAFLQPLLMSRFASTGGAARTVVLAIDQSASMGYADGTSTRLAQAAAAAEEVLSSLPAGSRANLVWLRARPASALPEPGPNFDFLRQELRQATVRPEPGNIEGGLALAFEQLASAQGPRELVVVSDFQEAAWRDIPWDVPPGVRLSRVAVGEGLEGNLALAELAVEPRRPVAGQEAQLTCRVRNFSAEPRRASVFFEAGEGRLTQAVEVAPWSESLAVSPVKFPREGLYPVKATIAEDRFPGDDVRHALAEVRSALDVRVAGDAKNPTAQVWGRAAGALDAVSVRRGQFDQRADVLFVAGWTGGDLEILRKRLEEGGVIVVQPAPGMPAGALRELAGQQPGPHGPILQAQEREGGWRLRMAREDHPVFALFAGGAYGDPARAAIRRRVVPDDPGQVLLAYEDGVPALSVLEKPGGGILAVWNIDLESTRWPDDGIFVPFFGEFLRHLASRTAGDAPAEAEPGDPLRLEIGAAVDPRDVSVVDGDGRTLSVHQPPDASAQELATNEAVPPGSYRWMAQGSVLARAAMNFPESESDLRRLAPGNLEASGGGPVAAARRTSVAELREGTPLWPWCLMACALFLLAEGVVIWRFPEGSPDSTAHRGLAAS